jgi:hypothetical protein
MAPGVLVAFQAGSKVILKDMAKRVMTTLVDDLDGSSPADETVRFAIDGTNYEIDLMAVHAAELRSALNLYIGAARRVGDGRMKVA